jgi:alkaline phosphatase D
MSPWHRALPPCASIALSLAACSAAQDGGSNAGRSASLLGPIVGRVTSRSASVWARSDRSATLAMRYGTDAALAGARDSTPVETTSAEDFTATLVLDGLAASTTYYYDVLVDGRPRFSAPYPRFKTFPREDEAKPFKVVELTDFCCFGRYTPPPTRVFESADAEQPDLVLIGGDFDHRNPAGADAADARRVKRDMFKDLYTSRPTTDDFIDRILRRYPAAHFWDDHDFAHNNADKTYPFKAVSRAVLGEYFPVYEMGPGGDWQRFRYGQAEFFLLDARSQRDRPRDPDGPGKSMLDGDDLGAAGQLEWLRDSLLASSALWKFVVSPVPFNPTLPKADAWHGYQHERSALVAFVAAHRIANVVVLSGDIHAGAIDDGRNSSFPEIVAPAANLLSQGRASCLSASATGRWSEGVYASGTDEACPGYVVLTVSTAPDRVLLEVKDDAGRVRLSHTVAARTP